MKYFEARCAMEVNGAGASSMDCMRHWQPCFLTVSAILIVLSTVVAKDAVSCVHVQSDSEYRLFEVDFSSWVVETCPEDLAKHAGAFSLMAVRCASSSFYLLG